MLGFEEHFKEVTHEHARNLMAEIAHVETTDVKRQEHDSSGLDFLLTSKKSVAQNADYCLSLLVT